MSARFIGIAVLALLYGIFGYVGLQLAVPPGYATLIWPASGIALAGLLYAGPKLWPGVFLGSFFVNAINSGALAPDGIVGPGLVIAGGIAAGSCLQAVVAYALVTRRFGIPLRLNKLTDAVLLGGLAGPVSCLISATVGVGVLIGAGIMASDQMASNWFTWWCGDVAGVLTVLPIAMLAPKGSLNLQWKGRPIARLQTVALIVLLLPLLATFFAWKLTSEIAYKNEVTAFARLVDDSAHALNHRIDTYVNSLDAGAALLHASDHVSLPDWARFVETLAIEDNLKGINGIGIIDPIKRDGIEEFLNRVEADGVPDLNIRPQTQNDDLFIIKYIEPVGPNLQAVGLDIAFEKERYRAATNARDTGRPTITGRILLVQDESKSPGFLLLRPWYADGAKLDTVEDRRKAFQGWVYAPFIGKKFLAGLTSSQGRTLDISVYDGPTADAEQLIYSSTASVGDLSGEAQFIQKKTLNIMERDWTIVWQSTPIFEASARTYAPLFILIGGLLITLLLGRLLYTNERRSEEIRQQVEQQTEEIAARERENRAVIDTAVVGVLVLDEDQRILSANDTAQSMFEYSAGELLGREIGDLVDLEASKERQPKQGKSCTTSPTHLLFGITPALRARTRSGAEIVLDLQQNAWKTEQGQLRTTLIIRDITVASRVAAALELSEERLSHAMEGAELGVFDIDLTTGRSFVSHTWKTMLGFDVDAEIDAQAEWLSRIHPEDKPSLMAADKACMDGLTARSECEYRFRHADGHWIWLRSDATINERSADGKALRMVGIQMDVSELKEAEAGLRSTRERLRTTIENAPVGMALMDTTADWLQINASFRDLTGYEIDDLNGQRICSIVHPDDCEQIRTLLGSLFSGESSRHLTEIRVKHRDGRLIWCLLSLSFVAPSPDCSDLGYAILQFQDINDRKEVERLKSEFVATVSHELRTPLTSIRGSLGLVLGAQAATLAPNTEKLLRIAHNNCERLVNLINDILDIEKITSGAIPLERETHSLNALVREAIDTLQPIFEKAEASVILAAREDELLVDVDAHRVQQVLVNLLSNAAKFSPAGGTIHLGLERRHGMARFTVTDEGSGVPPEFRTKIFERFSQADSSSTRAKGGTGLGLSICKAIIDRMDGEIGYYNTEDAGAVFWFELPLAVSSLEPLSVQTENADAVHAHAPRLAHGLHVEADDDFAEILRAMVRGKAELTRVTCLNEAREKIQLGDFDFLILDGHFPDGTADDFLSDLSGTGQSLPTLLLSSEDILLREARADFEIVKSRSTDRAIIDAIAAIADKLPTAA
ncbi:CHASE domain-containing protein [Fulvimarina sp. MAC8]|uniref:CHASE domain-containing protein n=1 Tax=Fulvimarina sp. MAC8 TaxID=3162874 RepID=UPI0032EB4C5A